MRPAPEAAGTCAVLLGLALAAACAPPPREPRILYGEQECERCRMIVSEERFAAASLAADGATRAFDDIACLVAWLGEPAAEPGELWVHDAVTHDWLRAEEAVYARGRGLITPMGSGWAAFRSAESVGPPIGEIAEGPIGWNRLLDRVPRPRGR